ncbi:MAG: hypothetical protein KDE27_07005 [Planctomycetes bacterium]|nr:hypothetical protein [Planctomycetota bacterium]
MRIRTRLAIALAVLPAACGGDRGAAAAVALVVEFEGALRTGDSQRCRQLVTAESKPAIAELPWQTLRGRRPLAVGAAEPEGCGYRVHVEDPNQGGAAGAFLVVREYGVLVVDLVATAGLTAEFTERPLDEPEFVPQELTPADIDRAERMRLAQPAR